MLRGRVSEGASVATKVACSPVEEGFSVVELFSIESKMGVYFWRVRRVDTL
jgi:hypothetical protein